MDLKRTIISLMTMLLVGISSVARAEVAFELRQPDNGTPATSEPKSVLPDRSMRQSAVVSEEMLNPIMQQSISADEGIEIYAFTEYNEHDEADQGLFKFNSAKPGNITRIKQVAEWVIAGAYAEQEYYAIASIMFRPVLCRVDMESGVVSTIADCMMDDGGYGVPAHDMSYDVVSKTMYMIALDESDYDNNNSGLYTIDVATGEQHMIRKNVGRSLYAMAVNAEGVMYAIDDKGMLCTVDKSTGDCTDVASTGLRPLYRQSMDFDRETGVIYWAFSGAQRLGTLYTVDATTATPTLVGNIGRYEQQVVGMHVPFSLYSNAAPSYVTDLGITPDATGALSVTLDWVCPTQTIGGEPLESIDYVEISRDGVQVATITGAAPGVAMSWSDVVDKAATYTYKVQAINSVGYGELRTIAAYVGHDVPAAVENLDLERTTPNSITLSWDAVTRGVNGGYIDQASLRYRITRTSDNKVLAEDHTDEVFVDNTITDLGRYRYSIESYNVDGVGGITNSGYIVNGPARSLPMFANFDVNDETEPNLWTVGDANGDGISFFWNYDDNYKWGAYYYQTLGMEEANDWLISPPLHLEAQTPYKVIVEAGVGSNSQSEQFSVYLIQDYDLSTAVKVGESFDITHYDYYRANIEGVEEGVYSVCIKCTSGLASDYIAIYSVEVAENGDGNIRGDVWDDSSKPVDGVYVSLEGTDFGAYTDARGFFEIKNVPGGIYTINSTKLGYWNVPATVTVRALKDVNIELDVVKRKAYTLSGSVRNEYGEPLPNAVVSLDGYTQYQALSDASGAYVIENVYEADAPYAYKAGKSFYKSVERSLSVAGALADVDVVLGDSILPPAIVTARYADGYTKTEIAWSGAGVDTSVVAHSDEVSYTFGAADGTFGTLIGVVCHEPIILQQIDWLLLNNNETINVVVLGFDRNGVLVGDELYVDTDAANEMYDFTHYRFKEDVYAPYGCFIGLSTDEGYLDIATAVNTAEKPFIPQYNAFIEDYQVEVKLDYIESLGEDYCENFFLGYQGLSLADGEAPSVTYNICRENEAAMSEMLNTAWTSLSYTDDTWAAQPDGEYRYSVTATYRNKQESGKTYSNTVIRDAAGVGGVDAESVNIYLSANGSSIVVNRLADALLLYAADGTLLAHNAHCQSLPVDANAGVYVARAYIDGVWYTQKIVVK